MSDLCEIENCYVHVLEYNPYNMNLGNEKLQYIHSITFKFISDENEFKNISKFIMENSNTKFKIILKGETND